ncbi:hypothetical protein [Aneurinibacillus tyrosinisolvens]|uniref:hypothetical protein n=1 Tax=Aneurinibacillus tyrosinisolvens TaxID=1443435 RepID=UPI00063F505C|nr:hypothetical protein [Aneurinibacillus tyrosinisolvens]
MNFCTKCGSQLDPELPHECPNEVKQAQAEITAGAQQSAATVTAQPHPAAEKTLNVQVSFSPQKVFSLIKDPFASVRLSAESDMLYGLLGILFSVIGYAIWAKACASQIEDMVREAMGGMSFLFGQMPGFSIDFSRLLLFCFLSIALLPLIVWLFANWAGTEKKGFKGMLTVLGGTQWFTFAGFIVTSLAGYLSVKFALLLFVVVLLCNLTIVIQAGLLGFLVPVRHYMRTIVLSVAGYLIAFMLAVQILL